MDDLLPVLRKAAFQSQAREHVEVAIQQRQPLSLVFVDVDHFKRVNDTYGHPIGDEVLVEVSDVLNDCVGDKGRAYRCGGEELAVLLSNYSTDEAVALAERTRVRLEQSKLSSKQLRITASFGVATIPTHADDARSLFEKADSAMYDAKRLGRNCVRFSEEPVPSVNRSREVARKTPATREFRADEMEAIRVSYAQNRLAKCPDDNAILDDREDFIHGQHIPDVVAFVQTVWKNRAIGRLVSTPAGAHRRELGQ